MTKELARRQLKDQKIPHALHKKQEGPIALSYIDMIVSHMSTKLSEPDSVIIEQFQDGEAMYLIAKGECEVIVGEESEDRFKKKLKPADD